MVLCFGVIRPYKGVDVLVEAFSEVEGAELWVVGRPLGVSVEELRLHAPRERVRFVDRYVATPSCRRCSAARTCSCCRT